MLLSYFDESGDAGYTNSPTQCFCLSTIIIDDNNWLDTLDQIINFRRYLKDQFGIPTRHELKANWLVHNKGPTKGLKLSTNKRLNAYKACMRFQRKCKNIRTFAIVINKSLILKTDIDPRHWAWTRAIERLERFGTANAQNIILFPDEGHAYFIKKKLRSMRRFHSVKSAFGTSTSLDRSVTNILEDPSDRKSNESYFIQFADLNVYAAFRYVHPHNNFGDEYWNLLGGSRIEEVNSIRGGPSGIVVWPIK